MKFFEDWGVAKLMYFFKLHQKSTYHYDSVHALFDAKKIYLFSALAFLVGVLMTLPIIYVELQYHIFDAKEVTLSLVFAYVSLFILFVFLEFYLLFLLGFYLLSYYVYHIIDIYKQHNIGTIKEKEFLAMLVRTVMELSEPEIVKYNINHKERKEKALVLWAFVYKVKVIMTNFILKFIAKKVFTRSSFRLYTPYIASLGTGLWDGIVYYKTIRHSQYKIMVRLVVLYLWEHKQSLLIGEHYTKLILARYLDYGEYNNNFDYLLEKIHRETAFNYVINDYIDETHLQSNDKYFILLLYALKEKRQVKKESLIIHQIDDKELFKKLLNALKQGDTPYVYQYIDEKVI
ncbi:MAG: hypothetical protein Q9M39_01810 [Sulfurovum sp.]|nr:hypothetical protein [Sulfurovum sp.]